jgi:hypothetical protein
VRSWLKDNEQFSDGVNVMKEFEGRSISVLKLSAKRNAILTCVVEGKDGRTSKNARILIVEGKFDGYLG